MSFEEFPKVSIRKGRDWQLKRGHPWLFSGAISQSPGNLNAGDIVDLLDVNGKFVARGFHNSATDIAVRVLTYDREELIDSAFLRKRIANAWQLRLKKLDLKKTNVFRLINAEGDFLPGFIVDYFDGVLSIQSHTAGSDKLLDQFVSALQDQLQPKSIVVRNDAAARKREHLPMEAVRVVAGECPEQVPVLENELRFQVDILKGQKTGFFTDQRDKRSALQDYCRGLPPDAVLLNCYCYTASFSVYALQGNSTIRTINVDQSERALEQGKINFQLNHFDPSGHEFIARDVFQFFDEQSGSAKYDVVILDPPAFAKTHKDKPRALKAYVHMIKSGINTCNEGALMIVASCSGSVSISELQDCLRDGAGDTKRQVQVVETFAHGIDHPILAAAPETAYLKVFFCIVT